MYVNVSFFIYNINRYREAAIITLLKTLDGFIIIFYLIYYCYCCFFVDVCIYVCNLGRWKRRYTQMLVKLYFIIIMYMVLANLVKLLNKF